MCVSHIIDLWSRVSHCKVLPRDCDHVEAFGHVLEASMTMPRPETMLSDNGPQYCQAYTELLNQQGISHMCTAPYTPMANGVCERHNALIKRLIKLVANDFSKQIEEDPSFLEVIVSMAAMMKNETIHADGSSPIFKMCLKQPLHNMSSMLEALPEMVGPYAEEDVTLADRHELRLVMSKRLHAEQNSEAIVQALKPGSRVHPGPFKGNVRFFDAGETEMTRRWKGPARIVGSENGLYVVRYGRNVYTIPAYRIRPFEDPLPTGLDIDPTDAEWNRLITEVENLPRAPGRPSAQHSALRQRLRRSLMYPIGKQSVVRRFDDRVPAEEEAPTVEADGFLAACRPVRTDSTQAILFWRGKLLVLKGFGKRFLPSTPGSSGPALIRLLVRCGLPAPQKTFEPTYVLKKLGLIGHTQFLNIVVNDNVDLAALFAKRWTKVRQTFSHSSLHPVRYMFTCDKKQLSDEVIYVLNLLLTQYSGPLRGVENETVDDVPPVIPPIDAPLEDDEVEKARKLARALAQLADHNAPPDSPMSPGGSFDSVSSDQASMDDCDWSWDLPIEDWIYLTSSSELAKKWSTRKKRSTSLNMNEVRKNQAVFDVAMQKELDSISSLDVWTPIDRDLTPDEVSRSVTCRWVYVWKPDGSAKARLVIQGFKDPRLALDSDGKSRMYSDTGEEIRTDSPTASAAAMRLVILSSLREQCPLYSTDISTAFLQGIEYDGTQQGLIARLPDGRLFLLNKALYGLGDAPRRWMEKLHGVLISMGCTQCVSDRMVYVYSHKGQRNSSSRVPKSFDGHMNASLHDALRDELNLLPCVDGIVSVHVDNLLSTGNTIFRKAILDRLPGQLKVGLPRSFLRARRTDVPQYHLNFESSANGRQECAPQSKRKQPSEKD